MWTYHRFKKDFARWSCSLLTEVQLDSHILCLKIVFLSVSGERGSENGEQTGWVFYNRRASMFVHLSGAHFPNHHDVLFVLTNLKWCAQFWISLATWMMHDHHHNHITYWFEKKWIELIVWLVEFRHSTSNSALKVGTETRNINYVAVPNSENIEAMFYTNPGACLWACEMEQHGVWTDLFR